MPDPTFARYKIFTDRAMDDKEFLYDVYKTVSKMYNKYPENIFPIGVGKEVFRRNPMSVQINGWGRAHSGTMEGLIKKIVRAYERAKSERWDEQSSEKKAGETQKV